jgi:hypothetical protein
MNSLLAGTTQSWFTVKVAVALSPMLTFWAAGVIGWFLRCYGPSETMTPKFFKPEDDERGCCNGRGDNHAKRGKG